MQHLKLVLIVVGMLNLSACSMLLSTPPTVHRQPPEACLLQCEPLPKPNDGRELTLRMWEYEMIELYGDCRRRHMDCAQWIGGK